MSRNIISKKCKGWTDRAGKDHDCDEMYVQSHPSIKRCMFCQKLQTKENNYLASRRWIDNKTKQLENNEEEGENENN